MTTPDAPERGTGDRLLMPQARVEILNPRAVLARNVAYAVFMLGLGAWILFFVHVLVDRYQVDGDVAILLAPLGLVVAGLPAIGVMKALGGQRTELIDVNAEVSSLGIRIPGHLRVEARHIRKVRIQRAETGCVCAVVSLQGGGQIELYPQAPGTDRDQGDDRDEYCRLCQLIQSRLGIQREK